MSRGLGDVYKRQISFEPTDTFIGKNVAQLKMMEIPESSSADFSTFMANVISTVKQAIQNKSEEQKKANEMLSSLREQLAAAMTDEDIAALIEAMKELPQVLQYPFFSEMKSNLASKGYKYENKKFVKDAAA